MKSKIIFIAFLLLFTFTMFGQVQNGFSIGLKSTLSGDKNNMEQRYSSFDTEHTYEAGIGFAGGILYQFKLGNAFGIQTGLLYDFQQFTQIQDYEYVSGRGAKRGGHIETDIKNQYLQIPLKGILKFGKAGIQGGVLVNYFLNAKYSEEHIFFLEGQEVERNTKERKVGEFIDFGLGDSERVKQEHPLGLQWVVGIQYELFPKFNLEFDYRNHLSSNLVIREIKNYDVVGLIERKLDLLSGSFSLGVSLDL